ncbi:MAG: DUF494 domain-containing protein, partial [Gammaproteobacteria bacterium]|nr:DUF494 domain-containing protein [Gammaproteobacteria bacterium]
MLEVLMYLFENYNNDPLEAHTAPSEVRDELLHAGFTEQQIEHAFVWLEALAGLEGGRVVERGQVLGSFRIYTPVESALISREGQGLLLYLEQLGVLNCEAREAVIDRVMALGAEEFDEEQLKWVVLMVLFNQPGAESSYAWME